MPNGKETEPDPELEQIRERLAELDQAITEDEGGDVETEFNELQESYRQLTGDYYILPKDQDI
ncbi:MAG: hypothetical protein WD294_06210 [Phycisphaeraceae bacterium]